MTQWGRLTGAALVGLLALTACGSDDTSGNDASDAAVNCPKGSLNGEGSTAQKNAIDDAIAAYGVKCADATVNYNASGSGAGISQFIAGKVEFAGSDSALKTELKDGKIEADEAKKRCAGSEAWNLPMITGPIAVAYKLNGVQLSLNGEVAAKLFLGQITKWNDPAIAALNPGATLPNLPVKVFFRSDESGTTDNFTKWLKAAAPSVWTADPGKKWTGKGEGKEKSVGVVQGASTTEGSLTYVEWSFARDAKLGISKIDNGAGAVELNANTVAKTVSTAQQTGVGNNLALSLNYATKEAGAYPVVLVSYEIVCSKGLAADKTAFVKSFLKHLASEETQNSLTEFGYVPLPADVRTKVAAAIEAIS